MSRIRQGRLVAPEDDSALSHLSALRAESPEYPGLAAAWADMIEDIVANANTAIENAEWADAEAWLDALEQADPASATLGRLRGELEHGRTQARFLDEPAPIGILRILERGAIAYPEEAQRNEVQGWVELEFVVDEDGLPREPRVADAEPEGWFEDAAAASIAQYRFEPFMQDGRRYERLIRVRVSFTLE